MELTVSTKNEPLLIIIYLATQSRSDIPVYLQKTAYHQTPPRNKPNITRYNTYSNQHCNNVSNNVNNIPNVCIPNTNISNGSVTVCNGVNGNMCNNNSSNIYNQYNISNSNNNNNNNNNNNLKMKYGPVHSQTTSTSTVQYHPYKNNHSYNNNYINYNNFNIINNNGVTNNHICINNVIITNQSQTIMQPMQTVNNNNNNNQNPNNHNNNNIKQDTLIIPSPSSICDTEHSIFTYNSNSGRSNISRNSEQLIKAENEESIYIDYDIKQQPQQDENHNISMQCIVQNSSDDISFSNHCFLSNSNNSPFIDLNCDNDIKVNNQDEIMNNNEKMNNDEHQRNSANYCIDDNINKSDNNDQDIIYLFGLPQRKHDNHNHNHNKNINSHNTKSIKSDKIGQNEKIIKQEFNQIHETGNYYDNDNLFCIEDICSFNEDGCSFYN